MGVYFFDTSGLVKRYLHETGTSWVQAVTAPVAANAIYVARITTIEVTSAVTRRQRAGNLSTLQAALILAQFRQDFALEYRVIEITRALFADAER